MELDSAVINGNWDGRSIADKIEVFTSTQKKALDVTVQYKQTSIRGNTLPRRIVAKLKRKRWITNHLRKIESESRIRLDIAIRQMCGLDTANYIKPQWSEKTHRYWMMNRDS